MFGGFLQDTSKTVFSWSYIDHLMDSEIAELTAALQLLGGSFIEGLSEATGEEGGGGEQFTRLAEIILAWFQENVDYLAQNRSVDYAFSLDTDGTFLYAQTMTQPELTTKIGSDLYNALPELLGAEQGDALQQLIGSKIKLDYDTVAGFSLSGLSNLFADIPPEIAVPQKIKDLPVNLYWAVKEKEAVAIAVGLDAVRTERALRTALGKTNALVTPKQTAVFAMKPTGEFLSRQVLPLMIKSGTDQTIIDENREFFPVLAGAESSAKVIVTTEFPNDAHLQKWQIDGRCFTTLLKLYAKQNELTAKRMVLEQQKQLLEQQRQELQEQPEAQESPVKPEPPVQEEEMQNPFDE